MLDEWQENVLEAAMGERSDGRWAAPRVALSAPRQNGKSQLIVARALAGILLFDEQTIIVSAHQQDTAREVFTRIVDLIEEHPALEKRVRSVMRALNRESITFKSGQVIRFKARSAGGGRGFSCDCLLLDEAQILNAAAWSAILPTMSARPNPQVWLMGTPPTVGDDGEVFGRIRDAGLAKRESRLAYLEWSADPADDLDAEETWAKANPAYGIRVTRDAIAGERATMTDDQFATERLGMWATASSQQVISPPAWSAAADPASMAIEHLALGVAVSPDLESASVALAGQRFDGQWHIELEEQRHGADWVAAHLRRLLDVNPQVRAVVVDPGSPAIAIIDELEKARIKITRTTVREVGAACVRFVDGVKLGDVWHTDQPQMNVALATARKRPLGETGMWAWNRRTASSDITPVEAACLALWGAQHSKVKKPTRNKRGGRRVVTG